MKQFSRINALVLAVMTCSMLATACSTEPEIQPDVSVQPTETETPSTGDVSPVNVSNLSEAAEIDAPYSFDVSGLFSERDLSGSYSETAVITLNGTSAEISGSGASADGSVITITEEGVYRISGTLDDGQMIVNSEGKVQLVLDNANISCSDSAAIYVQNAKKTFITLAEHSENSISDGETYLTEQANEPDAAIFSQDSLTINGNGTLVVNGNYNEGITSKDDLVICSARIEVNAAGNGIKGKDYVAISDADLTIHAGGDGIKSSNSKDAGMGFVYIADGSFSIEAEGDGIQAESELVISGGDFSVIAGGGTANAEPHTDDSKMGGGFGRGGWFQNNTSGTDTDDTSVSVKGLKAGSLLYVSGGTLDVEAADDALHSNGNLFTTGGSMMLRAGSKGIHADETAGISGGIITVAESYEGIEATYIAVSGGEVNVTASDDGFNASDGSEQGAMGKAVDCSIEISGGYVYVNAEGDGLDSNGSMTISGGIVLVDGPTNSGDGALDANSDITCTGGLLIAAGSLGMAEYPSDGQHTIVVSTNTQQGNTLVTICDSNGNEILSYAPSKSWGSFVVSSSELNTNETYTVYIGGSSSAAQVNGLYETGGYQNDGTEEGSVTLEDTVSFIGSSGGMGGMMGGFGGHHMSDDDMNRDDFTPSDFNKDNFNPDDFDFRDMQFPTDENGDTIQPDFGGDREFREDMQPPTDENGNFSMPNDMPQDGGRPGRNMDDFAPGGTMQNS